jgi:hypothetical protein
MEFVSSGMVNWQKDQILCDKILSSHAIAANVFLLEGNHQRNCASTREESKSYCGIQMRGTCDNE